MRDYRIQKLCAWSGVATFLLFFGAFGAAKFVLPPGPWLTQEQVVAMYQQNTTEIRIGMSMALISCMFFAPKWGPFPPCASFAQKGRPRMAQRTCS